MTTPMTNVSTLTTLSLLKCKLTIEQAESILDVITEQSQLKNLNLEYCNLSHVNLDLLRNINYLQSVCLERTLLNRNQLKYIFTSMRERTLLKAINLNGNRLPFIFAPLDQLENVSLACCRLTTGQVESFLNTITEQTLLNNLDLRGNKLSNVNPVLLKKLNYLQSVSLDGARLNRN